MNAKIATTIITVTTTLAIKWVVVGSVFLFPSGVGVGDSVVCWVGEGEEVGACVSEAVGSEIGLTVEISAEVVAVT